jgi:hypothetical protein
MEAEDVARVHYGLDNDICIIKTVTMEITFQVRLLSKQKHDVEKM